MCGIVGVIAKNKSGIVKQIEDSFFQLLYADVLRGDDSTGIIGVEQDTTFHISKDTTSAYEFLPEFDESPVSKSMWRDGRAYIGHNRKATMGKVDAESAHPFVVNNEFAMVHNGTLYNHKLLADTEVDSEALTMVLAKAFETANYRNALEDTLGKVTGAYAVAMYDQRSNCVRLLRNRERPMAFVETNNAWYFASEAAMLYWILSRNGYLTTDLDIKPVAEHSLMTFNLDDMTLTSEFITPKKILPPMKPYTAHGGQQPTITSLITKTPFDDGVSKNRFKKFRKEYLHQGIEFWCEDFVETNFPKTIEMGETKITLMGVCDSLFLDHIIATDVDITELYLRENDLTDRLWYGKIVDMSYDSTTKRIHIKLQNASPLPVSYRKNSPLPVIDAEYIRKKLDEEEIEFHSLH